MNKNVKTIKQKNLYKTRKINFHIDFHLPTAMDEKTKH